MTTLVEAERKMKRPRIGYIIGLGLVAIVRCDAVLLWAGTLFFLVVSGWRAVQWVRHRWSHWTSMQDPVRG